MNEIKLGDKFESKDNKYSRYEIVGFGLGKKKVYLKEINANIVKLYEVKIEDLEKNYNKI